MGEIRFNGLTFDDEFLTARSEDGSSLRFTRQERALLLAFNRNRGNLLSRAQLLDALAASGTEMSERNVDFLVNRLRAKLGDSARNPRFIATQYGEGYLWIARPESEQPVAAFIVIGPAFGLGADGSRERSLLSALTEKLDASTAAEQTVVCRPDWRPGNSPDDSLQYAVDASFHEEGEVLHAALVVRHGPDRRMLKALRATFTDETASAEIERLAGEIKSAIWRDLALPAAADAAPADTPLEIRLHEAAQMFTRNPASWLENEAQLARAEAEIPRDPALAIMRALNLYAHLMLHPKQGKGAMPAEQWTPLEDRIESLTLDALPGIQHNPLLMLGAAQLLHFLDRGHSARAEEIAEEAFEKTTAFAAAFSTLGQIRMGRGRIAEALSLYDKAIELTEPKSDFHIYLMVLKAAAHLAAGDRASLVSLTAELYSLKWLARLQLGVILTPPDASLPFEVAALLKLMSKDRARRAVGYFYRMTARQFRSEEHRANVMRGLIAHLVTRFGKDVVPPDVARGIGF